MNVYLCAIFPPESNLSEGTKIYLVLKLGDDEGHQVGRHGHGLLVVVPHVLVRSLPRNVYEL